MRHIRLPKESEAPQSFQRWKKRHPQANYGRFKDADVKRELKNSYIQRQGGLCCYCESRIGMETSHIEHIDPQMGGLSTHSMEYANMAASCIKDPKKESLLFSEGTPLNVIGDSLLHCLDQAAELPLEDVVTAADLREKCPEALGVYADFKELALGVFDIAL